MASFGIGAKLRQERVGKGLAIDDIARNTRIAPRFLEAIETDDYSTLPGLVFTRNFVRQYALILQLDPDPLLAVLPKPDESTAPLPNPPARARSSFSRNRRLRSLLAWTVGLVLAGGAGAGTYLYFTRAPRTRAAAPALDSQTARKAAGPVEQPGHAAPAATRPAAPAATSLATTSPTTASPANPAAATAAPVQVSITASERAWVQLSADGKTTFIGTLTPNETKEVSAVDQVNVLTGNAGALTISLNGKTLESLGPRGHMREVRLTAEGPRFLSKDPPPAPDPL